MVFRRMLTLPMMGRNISSSLIDDLQEIFDACFPKVGSVIGIAAVIILLATLVLDLPQLAALISQIPFFEENLGSFESP